MKPKTFWIDSFSISGRGSMRFTLGTQGTERGAPRTAWGREVVVSTVFSFALARTLRGPDGPTGLEQRLDL